MIGLSDSDLAEVEGNNAGGVARMLVSKGSMSVWQYAVRKASNGDLEQAPAKSLSVAEAIVGCGSLCAQRRAEDERESCEGAPHLQLSRM